MGGEKSGGHHLLRPLLNGTDLKGASSKDVHQNFDCEVSHSHRLLVSKILVSFFILYSVRLDVMYESPS